VSVLPPIPTSNWRLENLDQHIESVRDQFLIELDQMQLQTMKSKVASRKKAN